MKGFEYPYEGFKQGLRGYSNNPRNSPGLVECFNLAPAEKGLVGHEEILDIASDQSWGGEGVYTPSAITRTVTIRVTDYIDLSELETVSVYLDGDLEGTTNSDGELTILDVAVGGHLLKLTKTGYLDSDADDLYNDYIFVI